MLGYIWEGIRAGLVLSLLVGPLLVLLIQLSLRRGTLSSFAAASGIWCSDLSFVVITYFGLGQLERLTSLGNFNEIVGSIGALVLVIVGVVTWFRPPPNLKAKRIMPSRRGLLNAWFQGYAVNSLNPFTIFFWSAFTLTQVHDRDLLRGEAFAIYAGIIGVIIVTDAFKVLGARKLRTLLNPDKMKKAQQVGAVALGIFGLVLAVRVWW